MNIECFASAEGAREECFGGILAEKAAQKLLPKSRKVHRKSEMYAEFAHVSLKSSGYILGDFPVHCLHKVPD